MTKKVTVRISNEIGNQLFMYASSYAIASKLERILQLDNETAFSSSKNISKYGLNNFTISSVIADKNNKFLVRTNIERSDVSNVLNGDIDDFIKAYLLQKEN